jgi:hypothetical protein
MLSFILPGCSMQPGFLLHEETSRAQVDGKSLSIVDRSIMKPDEDFEPHADDPSCCASARGGARRSTSGSGCTIGR